MHTNRQIVKAVLQKDYATLKESVFAALYTKAGQAMEQAKAGVCNAVFNTAMQEPEDKARIRKVQVEN